MLLQKKMRQLLNTPAPKIEDDKVNTHYIQNHLQHLVQLETGPQQPMWGFYEHEEAFLLGYQKNVFPLGRGHLGETSQKIKCATNRTNGYFMLLTSTYLHPNPKQPSSHKHHSSYADRNKSLNILTSTLISEMHKYYQFSSSE